MTRQIPAALLALLLSGPAFAAPPLINFQGVLRDTTGALVEDGVYSLKFRLYDDSTGGTMLWETAGSVPVQTTDGLFQHTLGSTNSLPAAVFDVDNVWAGVTIDLESEMTPRVRLASVPYALRARRADTASVSLDNITEASHMSLIEDTVTAVEVIPDGSFYDLKEIALPLGAISNYFEFRISCTAMGGNGSEQLELYVKNYLIASVTLGQLNTVRIEGIRHGAMWFFAWQRYGSGGAPTEGTNFIGDNLGNPTIIRIRGLVPANPPVRNVTFEVTTVVIEVDGP